MNDLINSTKNKILFEKMVIIRFDDIEKKNTVRIILIENENKIKLFPKCWS